MKWQILWETNKFQVSFCSFKFVNRFFVEKNELQRTTKALISLRGCAGWSAPLLFAHILRRVFSATLAIDQAQVTLLLYGQLFNGELIYTHWNIVSMYTFVRGWIRNWIAVKVTFSKTVRGNEEWQIESVIKKQQQKKPWSALSTHCELNVDPAFMGKLILGFNVEQPREDSIGSVHGFLKSAFGAMTNPMIVYAHVHRQLSI